MNVRSYQDGDLEAVAELFTAAVHQLAAEAYDERQRRAWAPRPPDLEHWRKRVGSMHVLVAEHEGAVAGFLGYHDSGHIDILFTSPQRARQGVASLLHARAEEALLAASVSELFTEASEVARPFFERHRYAVVRKEVVQARGVDLQRYVMRRQLGT